MANMPWYVVGILITAAVMAMLLALTGGLIKNSEKEVVLSGILFLPYASVGKKGMETGILKAVIYALIVAAISLALYGMLSPGGLTDVFTNIPRP